jgi:hypothetical protein
LNVFDDSDDNFERPTIDEWVKEHISFEEWKYMMAAITLSSQVPFNFNVEGWTFKEIIFGNPEEGELMDKSTLLLKIWNYKGHEEVSDMIMIMLDSWIVHLFKNFFSRKMTFRTIIKKRFFYKFKNIVKLLLQKYISAEIWSASYSYLKSSNVSY